MDANSATFASIPCMRHAFAVPVLLVLLLGGCAKGDAGATTAKDSTVAASASAPASPSPGTGHDPGPGKNSGTGQDPGPGKSSGTREIDPCDLLTKSMAEAAIYQQVGPPNKVHEGNAMICAYNSTSGPLKGILSASLTTYTGGKAALTEATNFYNLTPVTGVGDSAAVDIATKVIVVYAGDLNFVISLNTGRICDDILDNPQRKAACWEDIRSGLIALARTVLQAR
jgi:hypothetical protein